MAKKYTPPHIKKSKQGSLHTALGVKKGDKIPASKLKIKASDSPALKKKKQFAINAKKWNHQAGGDVINDPSQDEFLYGPNPQGANRGSVFANEAGTNEFGTGVGSYQVNTGVSHLNPAIEQANGAISFATGIGNLIQNNNLRHEERLQNLQAMTPKYMINEEAQGLDNVPAYTQYGGRKKMGGPIKYGSPVGVVNFDSGTGLDKQMHEGINHNAYYDQYMVYSGESEPNPFQNGGSVSSSKAREILRDGTANGQPLTDKQKRYFGWIAGGKKQAGGRTIVKQNTDDRGLTSVIFSENGKEMGFDYLTPEEYQREFGKSIGLPVPKYNFAQGVQASAADSAAYKKDFYDVYYGNPAALERAQGIPGQGQAIIPATSRENAYKDAQNQIMKKGKKQTGGRIFTPTDRSNIYDAADEGNGRIFAPISTQNIYDAADQGSGRVFLPKGQTGTTVPPGPNPSPVNPQAVPTSVNGETPEEIQQASAYVAKYRPQLSAALRKTNPQGFQQVDQTLSNLQSEYSKNYQAIMADKTPGVSKADRLAALAKDLAAKRNQAVQSAGVSNYLNPDQIKSTFSNPTDYNTFRQNQDKIRKYQASLNTGNIAGSNEDPNANINDINFGVRSLYQGLNTTSQSSVENTTTGQVRTQGKKYVVGNDGQVQLQQDSSSTVKAPTLRQAGGYAVGQELNLTAKQIAELKKQGYKFENL